MTVRESWRRVVDLVYPRLCVLCRTGMDAENMRQVCPECEGRLDFFGPTTCLRCGAWFGFGENNGPCPECIGKRFRFRRAVAVARYAGEFRELILRFKYHRAAYLAPYLGSLLAGRIRETGMADQVRVLLPVPMGRWKTFWRGYNQAELLADHAGRALGRPVRRGALVKVRNTPAQSRLHRDQRMVNLKGAFSIRPGTDFRDQTLILVDDVLTTGATANECTEALLKCGAREVFVATLGR